MQSECEDPVLYLGPLCPPFIRVGEDRRLKAAVAQLFQSRGVTGQFPSDCGLQDVVYTALLLSP